MPPEDPLENSNFNAYKLLILDNFKRLFRSVKELEDRVSSIERRLIYLTVGLFAGREVVVANLPVLKALLGEGTP